MNRKPCLLVLAALLLAAVSASATPVSQAAAPAAAIAASAASAASAAPIVEAPGLCQATASSLAAPLLNPAPRRVTTPLVCGSCSTPICRGATEGGVCRIVGMAVYTCINALGNSCSNDNLDQCLCWNGPLP